MSFINNKPIIIWHRDDVYGVFNWRYAHETLPAGFRIAWAYDQSDTNERTCVGYLRKNSDSVQTSWFSCDIDDVPKEFRAWLLVHGVSI